MNVLVTGATGFIGTALVQRLLRDGHTVQAWVRSARGVTLESRVARVLVADDAALAAALTEADAVVHLAGAPVAGKRWSASYEATIRSSRVELTRRLVRAIGQLDAAARPSGLISGSAVGYYGDASEVTEASGAGRDFLARVCVEWEREAMAAEAHGLRVALSRTGIVLGAEGGALQKMLPAFRAGAGGRIGTGRQGMSWIHLEDMVEVLATALTDERYRGPFNATAPSPVSNQAFTAALGRVLGRPAVLPVPALALKAAFGRGAAPLLTGQFAQPAALQRWSYRFRHPELEGALRDLLCPDDIVIDRPPSTPRSEYLDKRGATYRLSNRVLLDQPLAEVFPFFSHAENLGTLTPPNLTFEILSQHPREMAAGTEIAYRIGLGPFPMRWRTRIESFEHDSGFVDSQLQGPYRSWWHEHRFESEGARTRMVDAVYYSPPFGVLGRLVHWLFIGRTLRRIFAYRNQVVRLRFGTSFDPASR